MRVRGLKRNFDGVKASKQWSHPMRVRGLKHRNNKNDF